jgi:hypothetical protein
MMHRRWTGWRRATWGSGGYGRFKMLWPSRKQEAVSTTESIRGNTAMRTMNWMVGFLWRRWWVGDQGEIRSGARYRVARNTRAETWPGRGCADWSLRAVAAAAAADWPAAAPPISTPTRNGTFNRPPSNMCVIPARQSSVSKGVYGQCKISA